MRPLATPFMALLLSGCVGLIYDPSGPVSEEDAPPEPERPVEGGESSPEGTPEEPDPGPDVPPDAPPDVPPDVPPDGVGPGRACLCDRDCLGTAAHPGLCIQGICGSLGSETGCAPGSTAPCPAGQRCWSGTGRGLCYPDFVAGECDGQRDSDGSCVRAPGQGCYAVCGLACELSGEPPDGGAPEPEPAPGPDGGDGLGPCSGTADECEAARIINEYRAGHIQPGECNHPLRWNDRLGVLAHAHQSGPFVRHSSHGYVENVGQAYGLRETTEYIIQFEPIVEPHCHPDGRYRMSHHCAAMFCNNHTVGIGVYRRGEAVYMTMMFGDRDGNPSW